MGELVYNGGIVVAILVIFMAGLAFKMVYTILYSEVLDKIECRNFRQCKIINNIVEGFEDKNKDKINIKNTGVYVKSELNRWKKYGIYVERMNDYGNLAVIMCIIIGAIVDMYLISNYDSGNLQVSEVVVKVSVYTFIPVICLIIIKIWDYAIGVEYKKKMIYEEIVNYIDNRAAYVTLNTDESVMEKIINDDSKEADIKSNIENAMQETNDISVDKNGRNDGKNDGKKENRNKGEKSKEGKKDKSDGADLKENEKAEVISQVLNEYL